MKETNNKSNTNYFDNINLLLFYLLFGTLHEACHLAVAAWLTSCQHHEDNAVVNTNWLSNLIRAVTGRYSVIPIVHSDEDSSCSIEEWDRGLVVHSGWIFSVMLALMIPLWTRCSSSWREENRISGGFFSSPIVYAAIVTAVEAIATDLLQFTPQHHFTDGSNLDVLIVFCGNFGIVLLNPMWLNVDGGRTALEVLEKMVEVTMMRG